MTALSGEKTLAELSAEFGVHPTMISGWKQELVTRAGELFARSNKAPAVADAQKVIDEMSQRNHRDGTIFFASFSTLFGVCFITGVGYGGRIRYHQRLVLRKDP